MIEASLNGVRQAACKYLFCYTLTIATDTFRRFDFGKYQLNCHYDGFLKVEISTFVDISFYREANCTSIVLKEFEGKFWSVTFRSDSIFCNQLVNFCEDLGICWKCETYFQLKSNNLIFFFHSPSFESDSFIASKCTLYAAIYAVKCSRFINFYLLIMLCPLCTNIEQPKTFFRMCTDREFGVFERYIHKIPLELRPNPKHKMFKCLHNVCTNIIKK